MRPTRPRTCVKALLGGLAAGWGLLAFGNAATAAVFEISDDGQITEYAAPTVYSSEGVTPIQLASPVKSISGSVGAVIAQAAGTNAISADLIEAVAWQESRFRHNAVSRAGAVGVMQLMSGTARDLGVDRYDLTQNVHGGAAYLKQMLTRFKGNVPYALAAYNAGPGAVERYGGVPPFSETQAYVASIMARLAETADREPVLIAIAAR